MHPKRAKLHSRGPECSNVQKFSQNTCFFAAMYIHALRIVTVQDAPGTVKKEFYRKHPPHQRAHHSFPGPRPFTIYIYTYVCMYVYIYICICRIGLSGSIQVTGLERRRGPADAITLNTQRQNILAKNSAAEGLHCYMTIERLVMVHTPIGIIKRYSISPRTHETFGP